MNELQAGTELPLAELPQSAVFLLLGKVRPTIQRLGIALKMCNWLAPLGNEHHHVLTRNVLYALREWHGPRKHCHTASFAPPPKLGLQRLSAASTLLLSVTLAVVTTIA